MKILPPENPRRLTGPDSPNSPAHPEHDSSHARDGARHYHYHAASDAERLREERLLEERLRDEIYRDERIRREAMRDHLLEKEHERHAHRRALSVAVLLIIGGIILLGVLFSPARDTSLPPAPSDNTAVQVTSEFRDGKWVAKAERVPTAEPTPANDEDAYAEGEGYAQTSEEDATPVQEPAAAYRHCNGHWLSSTGLAAQIQGRSVTL